MPSPSEHLQAYWPLLWSPAPPKKSFFFLAPTSNLALYWRAMCSHSDRALYIKCIVTGIVLVAPPSRIRRLTHAGREGAPTGLHREAQEARAVSEAARVAKAAQGGGAPAGDAYVCRCRRRRARQTGWVDVNLLQVRTDGGAVLARSDANLYGTRAAELNSDFTTLPTCGG